MKGLRSLGRLPFRRTSQVATLLLLLLCCGAALYWTQSYRESLGFQVRLRPRELQALLQTADAMARVLTEAAIPFFMTDGTLLGSWRHHGHIPWDDDLDLGLLFLYKREVTRALSSLSPHFLLDNSHPRRWKVYPANATPIDDVSWKFPFVDLTFYHFNDTHVWDCDTHNYPASIYHLFEVLPLRLRPFDGRQLPAPRDTQAVLEKTYGGRDFFGQCRTSSFNHRAETGSHRVETQPCWTLAPAFPLVHREEVVDEGGCNESLRVAGKTISWQVFPGMPC